MDTKTINEKCKELNQRSWEEHLEQTYGDQDFSSWDRYHLWLIGELSVN